MRHLTELGPMFPCNKSHKATKQWRIVEIELLAIVGWKWGCQPFSCPCSQIATHCRKAISATCLSKCLSKESMPFVKSKPPLRLQKTESWGIQDLDNRMLIVILVVLYTRLLQVNEELSRLSFYCSNSGFGSGAASLPAAHHGVVVSKICYFWLCSQLCDQTAAKQW